MSQSHFREICRACSATVSQCRCPSEAKVLRFVDTCKDCVPQPAAAARATASGRAPERQEGSTPTERTLPDGQHADHWVLSAEERAKGFVRPVRRSYKHTVCGVVTSMPEAIAETYARQPGYYSSTFCAGGCGYKPVGQDGDFVWDGSSEKVGT